MEESRDLQEAAESLAAVENLVLVFLLDPANRGHGMRITYADLLEIQVARIPLHMGRLAS